jgi:phosphatidate cytidylyltransferase
MSKNLKKRITTSILLLLILFLSYINFYALTYFLLITGVLSILEFLEITNIIFKKKQIKKFLINIIFINYIFFFFTLFIMLSNALYFKILIFIILLSCVASDIGGLVFGKVFKGPKLSKISPNKTVSGAFGSLIFSTIFIVFIIYYLTQNFELFIIGVGLITSTSCQIGDLFFSFLKRKSALKDTGNFLPGHGGVLDRIDGILLGLPVGLLSLLIIY